MNIKNVLTLVMVLFLYSSTHAQVKKQFQDSTDALTTVVIKDEGASDLDILNDQFDLDDMGMHQVIRITTEGDMVVDEPTPSVPEFKKVEEPKAEVVVAQAETVVAKKVVKQAKKVTEKPATTGGTKVGTGGAKKASKYTSNSSSRKAYKPYYSKKRFKKKKRKRSKRTKRNKSKCYRF